MSIRILIAAVGCIGLSCVRIDGGSVEISWVVRTADGRAITDCTCSSPRVATVRLNLHGRGGAVDGLTPCPGRAECEFPCQRQTGSTPFDIKENAPGEYYEISVTALGEGGEELLQVLTPAPILRSVTKGQPTQVEAFLLVAECHQDCSGMNNSGVCTRP
jgi:hypothetical protein